MARPLATVVEDVLDHIEQIREFTEDVTFEEFAADRKTQRAVERCLEVISEASRHLPEDLKNQHDHIPWRNVADMGNVLRHVYHSIAVSIVWETVKVHLPPLEAVMREIEAGSSTENKEGE